MSRGAGSSSRCGGGAGGGGGSGSDGFSDCFARAVFGAGPLVAGAAFVLGFAGAGLPPPVFGAAADLAGAALFADAVPLCDLPFVFATAAP